MPYFPLYAQHAQDIDSSKTFADILGGVVHKLQVSSLHIFLSNFMYMESNCSIIIHQTDKQEDEVLDAVIMIIVLSLFLV